MKQRKSQKNSFSYFKWYWRLKKNRKVQLNFFKEKGMDIYTYKQRSSLDESLYKFSMIMKL